MPSFMLLMGMQSDINFDPILIIFQIFSSFGFVWSTQPYFNPFGIHGAFIEMSGWYFENWRYFLEQRS